MKELLNHYDPPFYSNKNKVYDNYAVLVLTVDDELPMMVGSRRLKISRSTVMAREIAAALNKVVEIPNE